MLLDIQSQNIFEIEEYVVIRAIHAVGIALYLDQATPDQAVEMGQGFTCGQLYRTAINLALEQSRGRALALRAAQNGRHVCRFRCQEQV